MTARPQDRKTARQLCHYAFVPLRH